MVGVRIGVVMTMRVRVFMRMRVVVMMMIVSLVVVMFLPRKAGEGDRCKRWRGRRLASVLVVAPSTMLRTVPLPRRKRQGWNHAGDPVRLRP